jgi:hypothetical protein
MLGMLGTRFVLVTLVGATAFGVGCKRGGQPSGPDTDGAVTPGVGSGAVARPSAPPNALTLPVASIEAVVNPEKLPAYSGPTGSVEGTVDVSGPEAPDVPNLDVHACPAAIDTYGKLFRAGPPGEGGRRPLADAIVGITGYTGFYLPDTGPAVKFTIGTNCAYPSTTIAMTFGQRIEIDNASKVVFAPGLDGVFQPAIMIAPPEEHGGPVKVYPPHTGRFALIDTIQPFIRGDVFVLRQPLHAVSDVHGHYRIDGVPIGKLKVSALSPAINAGADADVDVRANVVEKVNLSVTYAPGDAGAGPRARPNVIP